METVSYSTIKMDRYELDDYGRGGQMTGSIKTYDKSDSHPKPLEHIPQCPDWERAGARGFDDRKRIEGYRSNEHL